MENIKYKNILLKFYVPLLEKLDPNEVSVQLLTAGVLTSGDKEKVEEKPSQREKSEELLMILATKGPRAYEEFVKALEKNHCFLAYQLLKEGVYMKPFLCQIFEYCFVHFAYVKTTYLINSNIFLT